MGVPVGGFNQPIWKKCAHHMKIMEPPVEGVNMPKKSSWNHHRVLLMFENLGWDFSSLHLPLTGGIDPISSETSTKTTKTTRATRNCQGSCSEELIHDMCKEIELKNKKLIRKSPIHKKVVFASHQRWRHQALDLTCSWTSLKIPTVSASGWKEVDQGEAGNKEWTEMGLPKHSCLVVEPTH